MKLYEMSDDELDYEISETYRWFAKRAFGVTVKEQGRLAALWAEVDRRNR